MDSSTSCTRSEHPPEPLRGFPPLSARCALREWGRRQRGGAALARRPLAQVTPVLSAVQTNSFL
ncbi:MAG TPA: hypothetical protein DEV74_07170 [Acidovorax sp.]|nr:hypothetical protein [Acidovorax sp.]